MMTDFVVLFYDSWQDSVWYAVYFLVTILVSMIVFFLVCFHTPVWGRVHVQQPHWLWWWAGVLRWGLHDFCEWSDNCWRTSVHSGWSGTLTLCVLFSLWDLLVFFSLIKFKWTKCMQMFFFPLNIYLKCKSVIIILKNHSEIGSTKKYAFIYELC